MGKSRDVDTFQAFARTEFTAADLAESQGVALVTARQRVARMVKRGTAEQTKEGWPGSPAKYRMTEPAIGRIRQPGLNRINLVRAHFGDMPFTATDAARLCDVNYGDIKNWLKRGIVIRIGKNENGENVYATLKMY